MTVLIAKFIIAIFFGYIAYDAHAKAKNFRIEAEDQRFNRNVLEARARRERIRSVVYLLVALAAFSTLFFTTGFE